MSLNILVVDDSQVMRAMIRRCLTMTNLPIGDISEACDGEEGLAILRNSWIDILLVDINMPGMNGEEMIRRIRNDRALFELPIIVISTEGSKTRIEQLEALGVTFIHKPFQPETIRDVIVCVLGGPKHCGLDGVLTRIAAQTFDELTYLFAEETEEVLAKATFDRASTIRFGGLMTGSLLLFTQSDALRQMTSNMLGLGQDMLPTHEQEMDALRELASVTCGNILPFLGGRAAVFDLCAPSVVEGERFDGTGGDPVPAAETCLALEKGFAKLQLFLDEPAVERSAPKMPVK